MKHGDQGDSFQLVVKGKVTVWIPMKMEDMIKPIEELREKVLDCISVIDYSDELFFDILVYFDPWKHDDDKITSYGKYEDFEVIID